MNLLTFLLAALALVLLLWVVWRVVAFPCPSWLAWLLDNPYTQDYQARVISRLDLREGLSVLDAGCGPGRLTVPLARHVGPQGRVLAVDIQPGMISKAKEKVAQAGLANVEFLCAPLGSGQLPRAAFDRALMVTVLGEIPDKPAALREVFESLRPGGFLSVTEVVLDPHYQSFGAIQRMATQAGFRVGERLGRWFSFTVNLERPGGEG